MAIQLLLAQDFVKGTVDIFNIGSGHGYRIIDIIHKIERITGKSISLLYHPPRNYDVKFNVLNIDKIKKKLNWEPSVAIEDGLKFFWDWFRSI